MHTPDFIVQMILFLLAGVLVVPITQKLGLGSILGYIIAGIIIDPVVNTMMGPVSSSVMTVSELGVIMLLFVVGLELEPKKLWEMKSALLGVGGLQMLMTIVIMPVALFVFGLPWREALVVAITLSLSSAAIVLPILKRKNLLRTESGNLILSVILFQAVAFIPIMIIIPLLSGAHHAGPFHTGPLAWMPVWEQILTRLGCLGLVFIFAQVVVRPFFRFIASTHLEELLTSSSLLLVIGVIFAAERVGGSPAVAAFVGGVMLANTEYRHEIIADIEPYKGVLLGIFFVAVGVNIDCHLLAQRPLLIAGFLLTMISVKFLVLIVVGKVFRLARSGLFLFALMLTVGDEMAFVILPYSESIGALTPFWASITNDTVALSMAVCPLLLILHEKFIHPLFATKQKERAPDVIDTSSEILILGYGEFGRTVGRMLLANRIPTTVIDFSPEVIDLIRKVGLKAYYGDATRKKILIAAGIKEAKMLLVTIDNPDSILRIIDLVKKNFPHIKILARTPYRRHAMELVHRGVDWFIQENQGSALSMARQTLEECGYTREQAKEMAETFNLQEDVMIRSLSLGSYGDTAYFDNVRKNMQQIEEAIRESITQGESAPRTRDVIREN
jgi:Kef-type K+ transport system membrane component KefB